MALAKNIYLPRTLVTEDIESRLPYEVIPVGYGVAAPMASIVQHGNTITMSAVLTGATIYYTTDGNDPTTSSSVYSAPFDIVGGELVKALVVKQGYDNSNIVSLQTRQFKVANPRFEITPDNKVSIFVDTADAEIHYTTDGSVPDEDSDVYTEQFQFTGVGVVKAIAYRENWQASDVAISRTIYEGLDERVEALEDIVGTTPLTTTATQVTDAINELNELTPKVEALENSQLMQDEEIVALGNIKADKDGNYPLMNVGSADNLTGKGEGVPAEFTYRTTGGSADVADGVATIQEIHGNSLVFNQLVKIPDESKTITESGVTITDNRDGSYTINGTATADVTLDLHPQNAEGNVSGHKYLEMGIAGGHADTYLFGNGFSSTTGNSAVTDPVIFTAGDALINIRIYVMEGAELSNVVVRPQLIDLTKMFGAGNEPNSVADFKALYPLDYYAHNEGEIVSFNGDKIKAVGFNQWDEEWEIGGYTYDDNATINSKITTDYSVRNKYPIKVFPNTQYYVKYSRSALWCFAYDANGKILKWDNGTNLQLVGSAENPITTPNNCYYLNFYNGYSSLPVTTYNHDICINLSWSGIRNGEYEPYTTNERELPIGKINTDGTITESAEGKTRLFPNGLMSAGTAHDVVTKDGADSNIGIVDLGSLTWHAPETTIAGAKKYVAKLENVVAGKAICGKFFNRGSYESSLNGLWQFVLESNLTIYNLRCIVPDSIETTEDFKNYVSGEILIYETNNPTHVDFPEPINLSYQVSDFGTEEILPENDDEPTTSPFKGVIKYGMNAEGTIRNLPRNYISKESMANFLTALSAEMGGTWAMTYNEDSGEFDFEFTENA